MKLLMEQVDKLDARLDSIAKEKAEAVKLPDVNEAIPKAVDVAMAYIARLQATTMPVIESTDLDIECYTRIPQDGELAALDSACELLEDYFDRHNSRVLRERQRAEAANQLTRGKRNALRVTHEEDDG